MGYIIGAIIAIVVALGGWWYWRRRQRLASRMISIVGLLREPVTFDAAVLARTAGRAWNADLGDGSEGGPDGAVVGEGPFHMIRHEDRMYLAHHFPNPYVEDPEEASEAIPDLRIRQLFREHRAWFSCDALGADGTSTAEEIREYYQRLAKLFVAFLDDNCLLIYIPETSQGFPVTEQTEQALLSDDPLAELDATLNVPLIEVPNDDPMMQAAATEARTKWPQFVAAFETSAGRQFSVKAPVSHADTTEFIWIEVTAIEGDKILGRLANDPVDLGPLKLGSKVAVPLADLNDWCYIDPQENLQGGFTIAAVAKAANRRRPKT